MSLLGKKALDVAANLGRRRFLNSAAALGAVTVGLAACKENTQGSAASAPAAPAASPKTAPKTEITTASGAAATRAMPAFWAFLPAVNCTAFLAAALILWWDGAGRTNPRP